MIEVDWSTIFKSFYEVVRIKVSCRDVNKIPKDRLYEMNKDLFVVSFDVKVMKVVDPIQPDKGDDGGNDDDKGEGNGDDEEDDLLDEEGDIHKNKMMEDKAKTPTIKSGQGAVSGARTVNIRMDHSDQGDKKNS
jgi:hypothetical protein